MLVHIFQKMNKELKDLHVHYEPTRRQVCLEGLKATPVCLAVTSPAVSHPEACQPHLLHLTDRPPSA